MSLIGHGIDIEDLDRFSFLSEDEDWIARVFTEREIDIIPSGTRRVSHIASRFSAKEAAMKALGLSFGSGVSFKDFEVFREPGAPPRLELSKRMSDKANALGVSNILLSLSHSDSSVIASVILDSH